jgi:hypothetical protein
MFALDILDSNLCLFGILVPCVPHILDLAWAYRHEIELLEIGLEHLEESLYGPDSAASPPFHLILWNQVIFHLIVRIAFDFLEFSSFDVPWALVPVDYAEFCIE